MRDSKNLVIGMLCAVVCIMAVAYAAFSTSLSVTTNITVDSNWCMQMVASEDCTVTPKAGGVSEGVTATITGDAVGSLAATVDMNFIQPGDTATCVVTFENCGTLNAGLEFEVFELVGEQQTETEITYEGTTVTKTSTAGNLQFVVSGLDNTKVLTPTAKQHSVTITGTFLDLEDQGNANGESLSIRIKAHATQAA